MGLHCCPPISEKLLRPRKSGWGGPFGEQQACWGHVKYAKGADIARLPPASNHLSLSWKLKKIVAWTKGETTDHTSPNLTSEPPDLPPTVHFQDAALRLMDLAGPQVAHVRLPVCAPGVVEGAWFGLSAWVGGF